MEGSYVRVLITDGAVLRSFFERQWTAELPSSAAISFDQLKANQRTKRNYSRSSARKAPTFQISSTGNLILSDESLSYASQVSKFSSL